MTASGEFRRWQSLPQMFFEQAARHDRRVFLSVKCDGAWADLSYGQAAETVRRLAQGLIDRGIAAGDRVVLVSENRPEFALADLAIMSAGAITVPAYTTSSVADHSHILTHSGAKAAIVSSAALAKKLLPAAWEASELRLVIGIDDLGIDQATPKPILRWAELPATPLPALDERLSALKRRETACFIYTSGTGGTPKGVMLSHGAMLTNCLGAYEVLSSIGLEDERFLSFLPLSHAYEHTVGQFFPISIGARIFYAESVEKLMDNAAETKPTIMTAVPRLYEVMHGKISRGLAKASPFQRRLFDLALRLGRIRYETGRLSPIQHLLNLFLDLTVRRKVKARFGGHLKALVSGGAALNYEIGIFFTALGLRILQGYGQTEAAPVLNVNPPQRPKLDCVGPALAGVEMKIASDGEILVRGEMVMNGYWRDPEATQRTIVEGWLHTGDIGEIDGDGYLKITDRKKDIIVLSGGDNASPARVEGFVVLEPEIAQAMVYGDKRPHLVALLVPDTDFLSEWARKAGKSKEPAAWVQDPDFHKLMAGAIERVNKSLSPIERIRRFALADAPFTTENEMLTPSMKIRRHKIRERYGARLEALYERGS